MDNLKNFLDTLNEETDGDKSNDEKIKGKTVTAQEAGVEQITWSKIPSSMKNLYSWYRDRIPEKERDEHNFYEFLNDVVQYLLSFSAISNINKAGELIAKFDMQAKKKETEVEDTEPAEEE